MYRIISIIVITSFLIGCATKTSTRFVLFSDTHVSEFSTGADDLRRAVRDVNSLDDIDFVLVSGDITDTNTGKNLIIAKQILDSLRIPYYIIPGNHDTKWSGSAGANFGHMWGDDTFSFEHKGYHFIGFHQGPVLRMDDGHIPRHILTWLAEELKQIGSGQPIILVMHYALDSSVDNWYECVDILRDYDVRAIIHGHGHRNRFTQYSGIPALMGRSTLRAGAHSGGFTLFTINDDSIQAQEKTTGGALSEVWAKVSLQQSANIEAVAESLLPDYSINEQFPGVDTLWRFKSGFLMTASPINDKERVFAGDVSGTMYCLAIEDGRVLWKNDEAGSIYATAAIAEDRLVYTSADSHLYCLNTSAGSLLWKLATGNSLVSVPVIEEGVVYFGSSDNHFRAVDLFTGEIIWEYAEVGSYVETKPLVYQDKVIFGAWDAKLYALDAMSGQTAWIWQGEQSNPLYSPAACWPVAHNKHIYIAAPDRFITAIDAETGSTIWRDNRLKYRETIGLSPELDIVFARSMTDSVIAFNTKSREAEMVWAENFQYGYDIAPSMPIAKDGVVYWGTKNGLILAAEAASGALLWKHRYQNYLINTVLPLSHNSVVFSNIDGDIVRLHFNN